jgi:tRNA modification GTPase
MAGIGRPAHPVEKEGIERGKRLASAGDGILLVLDASRKLSPEDLELLEKFHDKKALLLFNKSDLPTKMDVEKIKRSHKDMPALSVSALKGTHIQDLKETIFSHFVPKKTGNGDIILHLRQKLLFEDILACLKKAKQLLREGYSEEIFVEEIRKIIPLIGQLTGEIRDDDILDRVFNKFCIGK